ncbi:hypothetical protein [Sphingomonas sp.]
MNVQPPRSKFALVIYAAAGLVALTILADMWNRFSYTDHFNLGYQLQQLVREGSFVAIIAAVGIAVQYLADIRWLLLQQRGKDA